jgi:hypothetical protein
VNQIEPQTLTVLLSNFRALSENVKMRAQLLEEEPSIDSCLQGGWGGGFACGRGGGGEEEEEEEEAGSHHAPPRPFHARNRADAKDVGEA